MLAHAAPISVPGRLVDLVGTGGDGAHTVNISTMGTIAAAAAGARMVKHGNRAATSACGAAEVLEALGVVIDLPPPATEELVAEVGTAFLFAALYHPAYRYASVARRELGVPTVFNFLGPLTNPAGARRQLIGVSDPAYLERMAGALARLGVARALVVSSEDGLDEMSTSAPTHVVEVNGDAIERYVVTPQDVGLDTTTPDAVVGGPPEANAHTTRAILSGEPGPRRDLALLNAGAAIYAGGVADSLREGIAAAREAVDSGAAMRTTEAYLALSRQLATAA
jgi:anthranilate phosphoribosyltransferase